MMQQPLFRDNDDVCMLLDGRDSVDLGEIFVAGRWLKSMFHDSKGGPEWGHMHMYRKILTTYDPSTKTILLSKIGSRRLADELNTPDHEFGPDELYEEAYRYYWSLYGENHQLF